MKTPLAHSALESADSISASRKPDGKQPGRSNLTMSTGLSLPIDFLGSDCTRSNRAYHLTKGVIYGAAQTSSDRTAGDECSLTHQKSVTTGSGCGSWPASGLFPKIGRPSKSGLSIKQLGPKEYFRLYQRAHKPRKTTRRWWTGLSRKQVGNKQYISAWRAARKDRQNL